MTSLGLQLRRRRDRRLSADSWLTVRGARVIVLSADTGAEVGSATITRNKRSEPWPDWTRTRARVDDGRGRCTVGDRCLQLAHTQARAPRAVSQSPKSFGLSGSLLAWTTTQYDCRPNRGGCWEPPEPCKRLCAISVIDVRTGRRSVVARARFDPFDVTIVGRRIVWGENAYTGKGDAFRPVHGYVRMLRLP